MTSLRLAGLSYAPGGAAALLRDVDANLEPGWTGLIGANGAGKTTLLRLLSAEISHPERVATPSDLRVLRLDQRVEAPSDAVIGFATAWDRSALRLQARLGLVDEPLERWPTLSPGERRRWQLGAALFDEPDALLLDEPDNHLDRPARQGLLQALGRFRGIGVVVSHDRSFLDALTQHTVRIRAGRVEQLPLPASEALAAWDLADDASRDQWERHRTEARRAQRDLTRARARHDGAARSRSLRHADVRDHDARSSNRKSAAAKAEAAHAQSLSRARGRLERAQASVDATASSPPKKRRLRVATTEVRHAALCHFDPAACGPPFPLSGPRLEVRAGDRLWIEGPNGAGKSTLLRHLLGSSPVAPADRLWVTQEPDPAQVQGARDRLDQLPGDRRGHALTLLAALGADPVRVLASPSPSPGEARQLLLATALTEGKALLALDEPTHHLDLPARQRLAEALTAFDGAVLLVTHDTALAHAVCTARWSLRAGEVHPYPWVEERHDVP